MKVSFCQNRLLLSLLLILVTLKSYSQELAFGQVKYKFIHIRDTTGRKSPYTENLILLLGRSSSAYSSRDAAESKQLAHDEIEDQIKNSPDPNHLNLTITGGRPVITSTYYQFSGKHKLYVKELLVNYYLIEEELPVIDWIIAQDTLTIQGLHCQKATTHFKGRDYEAWFCPSIPFHNGPWKLNGLPGLIIQAADAKKEIFFQFDGFTDIRDKKIFIQLPDDATKVSEKDFLRLQELEKADPAAFYSMPSNQNSATNPFNNIDESKISSINIKQVRVPFSNVINNPIELPEKK